MPATKHILLKKAMCIVNCGLSHPTPTQHTRGIQDQVLSHFFLLTHICPLQAIPVRTYIFPCGHGNPRCSEPLLKTSVIPLITRCLGAHEANGEKKYFLHHQPVPAPALPNYSSNPVQQIKLSERQLLNNPCFFILGHPLLSCMYNL